MSSLRRKGERNPGTLSEERKLLIQRYMDEWLDAANEPENAEREETAAAEGPALHLAASPSLDADARSLPAPFELDGDAHQETPRRRRGRPRGARTRRQVHFHVDPEQDQMLLRAAGRFGSQQKALIAALHALNEVLVLRDQVELLQTECSRQRRLLAEAQALFRSS